MKKTSLFLCGAVLAALVCPPRADAKVLFTYSREQRMAVASNEYPDNANNVLMQEVQLSSTPPFFKQLIAQVVAECTDSPYGASAVKAYQYVSDRTRRLKLPASYVFDFSELQNAQIKPCSYEPVCSDNGCLLWGYMPDGNGGWDQSFIMPVQKWGFENRPQPQNRASLGLFKTEILPANCESVGGVLQNGTCSVDYIWQMGGLIPYKPQ